MKFKFNNNKKSLTVISTSAMSGILMVTCFAACTRVTENTDSLSTINTESSVETTNSKIPDFTQTPTETTLETYDFVWDDQKADKFNNYCEKKFNISLVQYVNSFGYTDELKIALTNFINELLNKNYKEVSFKKVGYFYGQLNRSGTINLYQDYDYFKRSFFNKNNDFYHASTLDNKLLISYLVANKIPYGTMIPLENLKQLIGNEVYTIDLDSYVLKNPDVGNNKAKKCDASILAVILIDYNLTLSTMCKDQRIKTKNLADSPETVIMYNKHLKGILGENAFQIGIVTSPEQYKLFYGEEPWDLSQIQGAIIQNPAEAMSSEETMNDKIYDQYIPLVDQQNGQFYGVIDYINYDVRYNKPNNEEQSGRSR